MTAGPVHVFPLGPLSDRDRAANTVRRNPVVPAPSSLPAPDGRLDAELTERVLAAREGSQKGERDLHVQRLRALDGLEVVDSLPCLVMVAVRSRCSDPPPAHTESEGYAALFF